MNAPPNMMIDIPIMEPSLALVLAHAARAYGVSEPALREAASSEAMEARALFCWLAHQVTQKSDRAIGLYCGLAQADVASRIAEMERRRAGSEQLAGLMEGLAIEVMAEAGVWRKLGRHHPERDPGEIARALVGSPYAAVTVGMEHVAHLAAAYLAEQAEKAALETEIQRLAKLAEQLEKIRASGSFLLISAIASGQKRAIGLGLADALEEFVVAEQAFANAASTVLEGSRRMTRDRAARALLNAAQADPLSPKKEQNNG